ncbi:MAG: alpha/beta hydrolase [Klebsiella huaxiensis]|uniref:alpha/beta hydrolase family protein n=1 Tax=Klebsiella huaxiensis TaxID=2153354 RepID=UPI0026F04A97|nr:alpha/beta fold hydrolase [Klebsiella huaxiensis]WEJ91064.1 MAG: alpha/beta hydrolase [Klebsiella huaxiensis]
MFRTWIFLLSTLFFCLQAHASTGFRQITLPGSGPDTVKVTLWYPTVMPGKMERVADNPAFVGISVIRNAQPVPGAHPLLVLSHGYNGNWRNLSWLATAMAAQGYIVAAPDHPGTTTFNQNPIEAKKLWRRPQDITRVINFVMSSPNLVGETDKRRIAAAGHSLGGWTVMELAGARFDTARFKQDCQQHPLRGDCKIAQKLGINEPQSPEKLAANLQDKRIKAIVSLDLGMVPGFTPQSLHTINIPVLLLAAQSDALAALPAKQESGYLASEIPDRWAKFELVNGATHFSFMQLCKPGAVALIEEDSPGDGIVCQDGEGANRASIHQIVAQKVMVFLNSSLDYRAPVDEKR